MSLDQLHPAVLHHIVNSLGWRSLRPFQEDAIAPIVAGEHCLLLAPTAGGKTEAALFPLFSRLLQESWVPLSVLYVCPLRALLNNLEPRVAGFASLLGRTARLWHGDVADGARRQIKREPPDVLLTTPESLEVMLVSKGINHEALFGNLRAVVVDELHAFAGDDRGWHLLAVLERISRVAGRPLQRVGLSATIGNPDRLLEWLAGSAPGPRRVIGQAAVTPDADVKVDAVGNLENAATVVARLHREAKRLVFCDSRSRVEELAFRLREQGTETYVSHGSLGVDERRRAEQAFAEKTGCVIVATSTLELGIDVGDLDHVIQVDAPGTVSSFLQRMGRTGRRPGTRRNLLFLATSDDSFLEAAGLVALWGKGFVEPVSPPALPHHVLAQQILGLTFQLGGWAPEDWSEWVGGAPGFSQLTDAGGAIVAHMLAQGILFSDAGVTGLGPEGDRRFSGKGFLEVLSVFSSEPLFTVLHGRSQVGAVDGASFKLKQEETPILLLGGRPWAVREVDWTDRLAYVEPVDVRGRSLWPGAGQPLGFALCRAIREIVTGLDLDTHLTQRGRELLSHLRDEYAWAPRDGTALVRRGGEKPTWWTFAGLRANASLADYLTRKGVEVRSRNNFLLTLDPSSSLEGLLPALAAAREEGGNVLPFSLATEAASDLKFADCMPPELAVATLQARLADPDAVAVVAGEPIHAVTRA